ncbi:nucleoporin NUP42 isoform X2 [Pelobates fuscus]|uniref:nucleoporin NUP42 isoform X2 n=1 Tax=Pelobates fuscus TaxID=191477 RepID=UPI002FE471CD
MTQNHYQQPPPPQGMTQNHYQQPPPPQGMTQNHYQQPPPQGGSRHWNAPSQQHPAANFSKSTTWTNKPRDESFKPTGAAGFSGSQNRFAALSAQDHSRDAQKDQDGNLIDELIKDIQIWESSKQWPFSVYSVSKEKCNISGFTDISPEELRLEYIASQASGNLQNYMNSVQQMVNNWKQKINELMNLNSSSKVALLNELNNTSTYTIPASGGAQQPGFGGAQQPGFGGAQQPGFGGAQQPGFGGAQQPGFGGAQQPGFGGAQQPGFGGAQQPASASLGLVANNASPTAATFSFKVDSGVAQNTNAPAAAASTTASFTGFGAKPTSTVGFGSTAAPSASSFSFAGPAASTAGTSVFGSSSAPSNVANSNTSVFSGFGGSAAHGFGGAPTTLGAPAFGGNASASMASVSASGFGSSTTAVSDLFKSGAVGSTSIFGQPSLFSASSTAAINPPPAASISNSSTSETLFTPRTELSAEDIVQFEAKKFTLGKIPLPPPSADLLVV